MGVLRHYLKLIFSFAPKLASAFSGGSHLRAITLTFSFWYFLISRKTFYRGKVKTFTFIYAGKKFDLELFSAIDISVLAEIFVLKEYEWDLPFEVKHILDLGAHWGDSAVYYALKYPGAKIYAVEPTPSEFKRLEAISKYFNNIVPIQAALSDVNGSADLYISNSSLGNSFVKRFNNEHVIKVKALTLNDLIRLAGIEAFDIVKFDIEGAEEVIFKDQDNKNLSKSFIGEIHLDLMNKNLDDVKNYFNNFNVTLDIINDSRFIIKAKR